MSQKCGRHSLLLNPPPFLTATGTVVGPKEGQGPLAFDYDLIRQNNNGDAKSFEAAELRMMETACHLALQKGNLSLNEIDYFLAGDLLNQMVTSGFCARSLGLPYFGLYGACATIGLGLALGAILIAGGFAQNIIAATSSHNCSAERQYRYPTEYGFQRPPHAQWTVTGAAAGVISAAGEGPRITAVTTGKVLDLGMKDSFALGAAMAPAAASTVTLHFQELQRNPDYYDLILTGDLGRVGKSVFNDILSRGCYGLGQQYDDCGTMIYNLDQQQVDAGGSGCACAGVVALGHVYRRLREGELRRVLLVATGSLHSPVTCLQGETIPAVAHAIALEM